MRVAVSSLGPSFASPKATPTPALSSQEETIMGGTHV